MRRRTPLRAGAVAGLGAAAGCTAGFDSAGFRESFEDGLGDWKPGAHVGPEVPLEEFEWEIAVSDERALAGDRSLRVTDEGDDNAATPFRSNGAELPRERERLFWSESESFNTLRNAVMRLGPEPPTAEEDFPVPGMSTAELGQTPTAGSGSRSTTAGAGTRTVSSGPRHRSRRTSSTSPSERPSSGRRR